MGLVRNPALICGSSLCYENVKDGIVAWNCISCGYQSNSYLLEGSEQVTAYEESLPELIKDIKYVDGDSLVWYPTVINLPSKGVIFPDGTNKDDWQWAFAPAVPVGPLEKERFKVPGKKDEYYSHKIDTKKVKHFPKNEFASALQEAGLI